MTKIPFPVSFFRKEFMFIRKLRRDIYPYNTNRFIFEVKNANIIETWDKHEYYYQNKQWIITSANLLPGGYNEAKRQVEMHVLQQAAKQGRD